MGKQRGSSPAQVDAEAARLQAGDTVEIEAPEYAFEVRMPPASAESGGITGVVLADRIKNMDWRQRQAEDAGIAAPEVIGEDKFTLAGLPEMLDWRVPSRAAIVYSRD
jgi:mRNA-degrading endonuclease toxin of MazEF toxin-antitoxin module